MKNETSGRSYRLSGRPNHKSNNYRKEIPPKKRLAAPRRRPKGTARVNAAVKKMTNAYIERVTAELFVATSSDFLHEVKEFEREVERRGDWKHPLSLMVASVIARLMTPFQDFWWITKHSLDKVFCFCLGAIALWFCWTTISAWKRHRTSADELLSRLKLGAAENTDSRGMPSKDSECFDPLDNHEQSGSNDVM